MHTVVIVDDCDINLGLIKALVDKLADSQSRLFRHPRAALEWCAGRLPDLLIVADLMPEIDGVEFIKRFRALPGCDRIPVLIIAANDRKDVRHAALAGGANDILDKPIDHIEFSARVRNMLDLRTSQKFLADRAGHLNALVAEQTREIRQREEELVMRLSRAAEFRDPETGSHIQRMAYYSLIIARALGLDEATCKLLLEAAPMHDIGKIGIPDYILLKPGRLTREEFELMKSHSRLGYELLRDSNSEVLRAGAEIARSHHERYDGSGYPLGLKGEEIPLLGRIVAVADVFDALTSERPYKKAWPLEKACAYLDQAAGKHFDPACVAAFLTCREEARHIGQRFQDAELPPISGCLQGECD